MALEFLKSTCAIAKYLPYQDTLLRTTLKKELIHFDINIEMTSYYKLNRVDERDLSHMV